MPQPRSSGSAERGPSLVEIGIALGGALMMIGAFRPWATFINELDWLRDASGVALGWGLLTLVCGAALASIGVRILRPRLILLHRGGIILSLAAGGLLITAIAWIALTANLVAGDQSRFVSLGDGMLVTALGAVIALMAAVSVLVRGNRGTQDDDQS